MFEKASELQVVIVAGSCDTPFLYVTLRPILEYLWSRIAYVSPARSISTYRAVIGVGHKTINKITRLHRVTMTFTR